MRFHRVFLIASLFVNFSFVSAGNHFEQVCNGSQHMQTMADLFQDIITPLYGDQKSALEKIASAQDRLSYMLLNQKADALGVVIFKNHLSQEFESLGIHNAIKLKTLFVVNTNKNSGVGLGSQLFNQCLDYAHSVNAQNIVVTVSEEKDESLKFFERKGFQRVNALEGKYQNGITEFILVKSLKAE